METAPNCHLCMAGEQHDPGDFLLEHPETSKHDRKVFNACWEGIFLIQNMKMTVLVSKEKHRTLLAALLEDDGCDYGFPSRIFSRSEVFPPLHQTPTTTTTATPTLKSVKRRKESVSKQEQPTKMPDIATSIHDIHSDLKVIIQDENDRDDRLAVGEKETSLSVAEVQLHTSHPHQRTQS